MVRGDSWCRQLMEVDGRVCGDSMIVKVRAGKCEEDTNARGRAVP